MAEWRRCGFLQELEVFRGDLLTRHEVGDARWISSDTVCTYSSNGRGRVDDLRVREIGLAHGHPAGAGRWERECLTATRFCSRQGQQSIGKSIGIDLDTGTPLKESLSFGAAIVSMMMMQRYQHVQVSHETMVLAGVVGLIVMVLTWGNWR